MATTESPTTVSEITKASAGDIAELVRAGRASAREVVDAHIARIEEVDDRLNAVVLRRFDEARADADAIDAARSRGETLGLLAGVPTTVKEQFDVGGLPTTFGLPSRAHAVAQRDGPMVGRLREAGAVVLGKTNVAQLLLYQEGDNPLFGKTSNPWDLERSSGGGSGGEGAIIAAFGSALGYAADIGGSIRTPAHFCGIQGFRPTSNRLTNIDSPRDLLFPGFTEVVLDPGPMARTVADLELAMQVLAAPGQERIDPRIPPVPWPDYTKVSLDGLRVAVFEQDGYWPASPALRRAVREAAAALSDLGADVEEFSPPGPELATAIYFGFLSADGLKWTKPWLKGNPLDKRTRLLKRVSAMPDPLRPVAARLLHAVGQPRLGRAIANAKHLSSAEFFRLAELRDNWRAEFMAALDAGGFEAIICPPHAIPAMRHGDTNLLYDTPSYLMRFNVLGMPAGAVAATRVRAGEESDRPVTYDAIERLARKAEQGSAGLPVGVQVAARHWRDDIVLAVMAALEEHFRRQPDYPAQPPI